MAGPKYEVTVTYTFTFDTDQYYDVDDERENFDPIDPESVLDYIYTDSDVLTDELSNVDDSHCVLKRVDEKGA
jgi:hypothetical protein